MLDKRPLELFLKWDAAQVLQYVHLVLPADERAAAAAFLEHNVDGALLPHLTLDHLKEIGVALLHLRLVIKKHISELIAHHHQRHPAKLFGDIDAGVAGALLGAVALELLQLLTVLVRETVKRLSLRGVSQAVALALASLALAPDLQLPTLPDKLGGLTPLEVDVRKLNDNFNRLKKDLIPVIRLLKDLKPLPTPTLDPGSTSAMDSPTYSHRLDVGDDDRTPPTLMAAMVVPAQLAARPKIHKAGSFTLVDSVPLLAPDHRFSQATLLSMGTGKIVQQLVPKLTETRLAPDFKLQKVQQRRRDPEPPLHRGIDAKPLMQLLKQPPTLQPQAQLQQQQQQQAPPPLQPQPLQPKLATAAAEPLKQLRASLDDLCLKILQQAMKRHHIPRDDWLKYVLVICYGNKERILKLAEKPVIIFKELQELGKHPAIMLRQLAEAPDDGAYDDLRIADDIPGGTL